MILKKAILHINKLVGQVYVVAVDMLSYLH